MNDVPADADADPVGDLPATALRVAAGLVEAARIETEIAGAGSGGDPFAAVVRATRMPMVVTNPRLPDNPVVFANGSFCRLTGYAREEIVGRNCRFLQGPETDEAAVARIRDAVGRGQGVELDIRNHRKDGEPFWNRLLIAPVRAADGSVAYFVASQVDVTLERERLAGLEHHNAALAAELAGRRREQQEGEARLRFATEAGRLGVWELDLASFDLTCSDICKENYGRSARDPFGYDDLMRAVHPDDRERLLAAVSDSILSGDPCDVEYRITRHDGSPGWVQVRAQVVRSPEGLPIRLAGISLDVTARRAGDLRLELSEQSLRLATEAAGLGTWDLDLVRDALTLSERTRVMFGMSPSAPCSLADFHAGVHPDDRDAVAAALAAATDPARRSLYDVEFRTIGKEDGAVRWVAAKGRGLFDAGRCHRALGTALDITHRKLAETREAMRAELGDALRGAADPAALLAIAAERLGRHLGATCVGYAEVDPAEASSCVLSAWAASAASAVSRGFALDDLGPLLASALRAGRSVAVRDAAADDRIGGARAAYEAIGARALVNAPLVKDGRLVGILFALNAAPRVWTPGEVGLIEEVAERTWSALEQVKAAAALRRSEARFEAIVDSVDQMIWSADPRGRHDYYNRRWYDFTGLPQGSMSNKVWRGLVHPDDHEAVRAAWVASLADGSPYRVEYRLRDAAGEYRWVLARAQAVRDEAGAVTRWFGTCTVIQELVEAREVMARSREELEALVAERTGELMQAEAALRQAQKMEAVGHLTGGLAHDFNNLLSGIMGSLELVQRRVAAGRMEGLDRFTDAAVSSARRAAALTQRLLAFARRQPLDPRRVEANRLAGSMADLLRRTLGPGIELEIVAAPNLWPTLCDPNQLESAVLNLAINARDAMPDGGRLTIETTNAHLDDAYCRAQGGEVRPGQYVALSVTDTGTGMTPDVIAQAFDPFFTTKPIGQGTGLGLSMLYGFVKQSGGHVRVYSEPGRGTTFTLYLPRQRGGADEEIGFAAAQITSSAPVEDGETVLVVDDEDTVRTLVTETLREHGYAAVEACDGPEGLRLVQSGMRIDLLVTDVGLPGLNGRQLADAARASRPGLRVLFMTGYAHNAAVGNGAALEPGMEIMSKPFTLAALAEKVREMIEPR
jgi:PAS domain S-box-containing protein